MLALHKLTDKYIMNRKNVVLLRGLKNVQKGVFINI